MKPLKGLKGLRVRFDVLVVGGLIVISFTVWAGAQGWFNF